MRIIGGKDYYDTAMAFGADTSVVFAREKDRSITAKEFGISPEIEFNLYHARKDGHLTDSHAASLYHHLNRNADILVRPIAAIIGDVLYKGAEVYRVFHDRETGLPYPHVFCWTLDAFTTEIAKFSLTVEGPKKDKYRRFRSRYREKEVETAEQYFAPRQVDKPIQEWLITNGIAVAAYRLHGQAVRFERDAVWTLNGDDLKTIEFYRLKDAYATYQDISMWVGGVLPRPGAEMVEISDVVRAQKHGFDKWSFRKPPEPK